MGDSWSMTIMAHVLAQDASVGCKMCEEKVKDGGQLEYDNNGTCTCSGCKCKSYHRQNNQCIVDNPVMD